MKKKTHLKIRVSDDMRECSAPIGNWLTNGSTVFCNKKLQIFKCVVLIQIVTFKILFSSLTWTNAFIISSNLEWALGTVGCFSGNIAMDFFLKCFLNSLMSRLSSSLNPSRIIAILLESSFIFQSSLFDAFYKVLLLTIIKQKLVNSQTWPNNEASIDKSVLFWPSSDIFHLLMFAGLMFLLYLG